jgi:anti-sigma B factor antagonist
LLQAQVAHQLHKEADMELSSKVSENGVLVLAYGEDNLDAANVRSFRDATQALMKDHARVVLDMSRMKFVDSSGLGALIACLRDANGRKGDFRMAAMSKSVRALFELMRMHRVFSIHETVDGAVSSFL